MEVCLCTFWADKFQRDFIQKTSENLWQYIENFIGQMRTGRVEYAEPLCEHAMRYLLSFWVEVQTMEYWFSDIEVKVWSDECLAKCTAVVRGNEAYF